MTYDEFLDNEKSRGMVIYMCLNCTFRGTGAAVSFHEIYKQHQCISEDKRDSILIDMLTQANKDKTNG